MKKNRMMRLASLLLILVLLTSSVVGGTFAKYTTTKTGTDTARVAKWGVEITATGEIFKTDYNQTAVSASTEKIVAPGTGGDLAAMNITGSPEVDVEVEYKADLTLTGWVLDGDYYCPLVITVNSTEYDGMDYDNIAEFEADVESAINDYTDKYEANTDLDSTATPAVSWEWPFEVDDANNAKDTKLGNVAVAGNGPTIRLDITCTVNQIQ